MMQEESTAQTLLGKQSFCAVQTRSYVVNLALDSLNRIGAG